MVSTEVITKKELIQMLMLDESYLDDFVWSEFLDQRG